MATITATLLSATIDSAGATKIVIEFQNGTGKWQKTYTYRLTETIKLADFKARVIADLKADLGIKNQLAELQNIIGKPFTITI